MTLRKEIILSLARTLSGYPQIAVAGGPLTGKSLFHEALPEKKWMETDAFAQDHQWKEQPAVIISECEEFTDYLLTGVQVGRCLRRGLTPDLVVWLREPLVPLTIGQEAMRRGCEKIFEDWRKWATCPVIVA